MTLRINAPLIDLHLVSLRVGRPEIVAEHRDSQIHSRIIELTEYLPIHPEDEVRKLLLREPQQSGSSHGLDDIRSQFHEAAGTRHLPAIQSATAQWSESRFHWQRPLHNGEGSLA